MPSESSAEQDNRHIYLLAGLLLQAPTEQCSGQPLPQMPSPFSGNLANENMIIVYSKKTWFNCLVQSSCLPIAFPSLCDFVLCTLTTSLFKLLGNLLRCNFRRHRNLIYGYYKDTKSMTHAEAYPHVWVGALFFPIIRCAYICVQNSY